MFTQGCCFILLFLHTSYWRIVINSSTLQWWSSTSPSLIRATEGTSWECTHYWLFICKPFTKTIHWNNYYWLAKEWQGTYRPITWFDKEFGSKQCDLLFFTDRKQLHPKDQRIVGCTWRFVRSTWPSLFGLRQHWWRHGSFIVSFA